MEGANGEEEKKQTDPEKHGAGAVLMLVLEEGLGHCPFLYP